MERGIEMGKNAEYVTSDGVRLELKPVSLILMQKVQISLRNEHEKRGAVLTPPQYCVELPGGGKQCYDHDKDTIADAATPEAEKQLWKQYQEDLTKLNSELGDRILGAIIMDQPIEFEPGWEKRLEWLGITVPEDELDRKMLYMTTRVLKSAEDIEGYMLTVMEISSGGANEDAIKAARAMFRRNQEE
jgi:hypothetical protein